MKMAVYIKLRLLWHICSKKIAHDIWIDDDQGPAAGQQCPVGEKGCAGVPYGLDSWEIAFVNILQGPNPAWWSRQGSWSLGRIDQGAAISRDSVQPLSVKTYSRRLQDYKLIVQQVPGLDDHVNFWLTSLIVI